MSEPKPSPDHGPTVGLSSIPSLTGTGGDTQGLSPAASSATPPLIGPYVLLGELGRGGMGVVYRAEDPRLKREVALKVMLPQFAANPVAKARFVREARAQAKVEHDHVAAIHQVDEHDGLPYIVMPLLKGMTLHAALKANPRPPLQEVIRIGREMAEGLAAAHEKGLVHRDIKPANVWLEGKKLRVKVLDFGLARIASDAATEDTDGPVTQQGAVVGTPAYMSPEQGRGLPVDGRTDLWSLGVVLYQMTTGGLPFRGATQLAILTSLALDHPPPPVDVNPAVPPHLSDFVMRLLAKDPGHRPPTAEAAAEELKAIEAGFVNAVRVVPLDAPPPLVVASVGPDPFADLDATEANTAEPEAEVGEEGDAPVTPAKPRGGFPMWAVVGVVLLAVAGIVGFVASKMGKNPTEVVQEPEPPKERPGDTPLIPQKPPEAVTIDVLSRIDPVKHGLNGTWRKEDGALVNTRSSWAAIELPVVPTRSYRIEAVAQRLDPFNDLVFGLPVGTGNGQLHLECNGPKRLTGFDVNGMQIGVNSAAYSQPVFKPGTPTTIRIEVTPTRVRAECDGVRVVDWNGDPISHTASNAAHYKFRPGTLWIGSWDASFRISKLTFTALDGPLNDPPTLPADPTFFNGKDLSGWEGATMHWKAENGALVGTGPPEAQGAPFITTKKDYTDFELSYRIAMSDSAEVTTRLVFRSSWVGPPSYYAHGPQFNLRKHSKDTFLTPRQDGGDGFAAKGSGVRPDAFNEVKVRCVGKQVTVTVNGESHFDGEMTMPPKGRIGFTTGPKGRVDIRDIRFTDLSKPIGLDLLALIDLKKDVIEGDWQFEEGRQLAVNGTNAIHPRVRIPYFPPEEYDLHVSYTRIGVNHAVKQILVADGRQFQFISGLGDRIGGFEDVAGVGLLDDKNTTRVERPKIWPALKRRYESVIQVRRTGIKVYHDGELLCEYAGKLDTLGLRKTMALPEPTLGLAAQVKAVFHRVSVVEVTGRGTFLRPDDPAARAAEAGRTPAARGEPLFNGKDLTGWKHVNGSVAADWAIEDGCLVNLGRAQKDSNIQTAQTFTDFTFRCEFRLSSGTYGKISLGGAFVDLIDAKAGSDGGESGTIRNLGGTNWLKAKSGQYRGPDQWNTLEVVRQGTQFRVSLNGVVVNNPAGPVQSTPKPISITQFTKRAELRNLEVLVPSPVSQAPPGDYKPLFNGKDFANWNVSTPSKAEYVTEAGKRAVRITPVYDLVLKDAYRDFHLKADFLTLAPGTTAGIAYRSGKDIFSFDMGAGGVLNALGDCEARPGEIKDGRVVAKNLPSAHGIPALPGLLNPVGQWNNLDVVVIGDTAVHVLNGKVVCVGADLRVNGVPSAEGTIRLYCSGGEGVVFNNVRIREVTALPEQFGGPKTVGAEDRERKAAEVLHRFCDLGVGGVGKPTAYISPNDPLPTEPFSVRTIGVNGDTPADSRAAFFQAVPDLPGVTRIADWFNRLKWTDADFALLAGFPLKDTLTEIVLPSVELTPGALDGIQKFLALRHIAFEAQSADDALLDRVATEHPTLARLALKRLGFRATPTAKAAAALGKLKLEQLTFLECKRIDAAWCKEVAKIAELRTLSFDGTPVDDAMLAEVAKCPGVRKLTLFASGVTPAGLEALRECKTLTELHVKGNDALNEAGAKRLAGLMPQCKIVWDGGVIEAVSKP